MSGPSDEPLSGSTKALVKAKAASKRNFAEQFSFHSERGAALAAVAKLDDTLARAMKANMVDDPSLKDWLFSGVGPLGSFGLKIRLAYMTGMYHKFIYKELKLVEDVRNLFAHNPDAKDFANSRIQGKCSSLQFLRIASELDEEDQTGRKWLRSFDSYDLSQPSYRFLATCILLGAFLELEVDFPPPMRQPRI